MFFTDKNIGEFLKKIILQSARLPVFYLLAGVVLIALSTIDKIFPITNWKDIFTITDLLGEIVMAFAITCFIYNCIVSICLVYEKKYTEKHQISALIFSTLRKGVRIIFILVVINIIISIAAPTQYYLIVANDMIHVIIIASVGWIAIQILYTLEAIVYQHMMKLTRTEHLRVKALYTKMLIIRNIATVIIVILTIAAILMSFSSVRNIGISLLASAGFLTAIIGLSAQKALVSLFAGLQIAMSQPIKIGDIVVIDGESGIIEEITFTYVTLKLGDRRRLVVPITYFVEKPFENWSHEGDSLRSSLHLYVDYLIPIEPLREALNNILDKSAFWDRQASNLQVSDLTEQSVEIRIQVSAGNADDLADLRAEVREKILEYIRTHHPEHFPKIRRA